MILIEYIEGNFGMTSKPIPQQDFLRDAMAALGMTRDQFADRIGTSRRRLDNWLLPSDSKGFRAMDEMAWKFIREILNNNPKRT
jgi:aspartate carbamoyltransferase catalytic subunit